jgi:hypothetical protein
MAALRTEQVEYLLQHLAQHPGRANALGVFAADCLPPRSRVTSCDTCFVLNTDPRSQPGAHWLAFYYDSVRRQLEYFDSFGLPLAYYPIVAHSLSDRKLEVAAKNTYGTLQSLDSTACGYYCILFLHYRVRFGSGSVAANKISKLGRSDRSRDVAVVREVHKLMHKHHCTHMPSVAVCTRFSQRCVCLNQVRNK